MARIPPEELERLKREVSLVELVRVAGVKLERRGEDLVCRCVFHEEETASLSIHPEKNVFHCFGCGASGNVVDWVMRRERVSFRHAVELLRERSGFGEEKQLAKRRTKVPAVTVGGAQTEAPVFPLASRLSTLRPKLASPLDSSAEDQELLRQVVSYYHSSLLESPEAMAYLESRGLAHAEMIERFELGFANRTLGYRLPARALRDGRALKERLERLGILRASGHEHLNGRVVVPILGERGEVVQMYGRTITPNLRAGTPHHLYLPAPLRGVFNREALAGAKEVLLCEALLDALTFWCAGYRNVTASFGVEGFTADHLAVFEESGIERVLIAYDRDEAGERGASDVAKRLQPLGIACYRVEFPHGLDANAYARKVQPAEKSLDLVLRHARYMGEGEPATGKRRPPDVFPLASLLLPEKEEKQLAKERTEEPEASVLPATPQQEVPCEVKGEEVVITLGDRRYRVRGLQKNLSYDLLKVNLLASRGDGFHVDTLDLYAARARAAYVKQSALELGLKEEIVQKDIGKVLLKLEQLQDEQITAALAPKETGPKLSEPEQQEALELLRDPGLLARLLSDLEACGVVGESTNKLVCYLAAISRKQPRPLAILIQSSSAAGKSALMNAVLAMVPEEERVHYSAMTGQSLFYMGETDLEHKVLAIAEEEGAERASYALKLLQSEGELSIASTGKDPSTGRLVTHEYRVKGPVAIFLTTTAVEIDEELLNRCLVLTVDEDREQTRAIHAFQRRRETLAGQLALQRKPAIVKLHQNAQRLLQAYLVANPYAEALTFPDQASRTRRDHEKYLGLIRAVTLLHQHQREVRRESIDGRMVEYLQVTLEDIEIANRLAREVLSRSLDELPPQTRKLLLAIDRLVEETSRRLRIDRRDVRFSRRDVRTFTGWGHSQLALHLHRLEALEYVLVHRGRHGQSFVYELLYETTAQAETMQLAGLLDVEKLRERERPVFPLASQLSRAERQKQLAKGKTVAGEDSSYDGNSPGLERNSPGLFRAVSGGLPGDVREGLEVSAAGVCGDYEPVSNGHAHLDQDLSAASYGVPRRRAALARRAPGN